MAIRALSKANRTTGSCQRNQYINDLVRLEKDAEVAGERPLMDRQVQFFVRVPANGNAAWPDADSAEHSRQDVPCLSIMPVSEHEHAVHVYKASDLGTDDMNSFRLVTRDVNIQGKEDFSAAP